MLSFAAWSATPESKARQSDDARARIGEIDLDGVPMPEKHRFKACYKARFLHQANAQTKGKPSSWISNYRVLFEHPIDQTFLVCLPEPGVSGSALFTGANWIFLSRNPGNQLHGDVVGADRKRTRFIITPYLGSPDRPLLFYDSFPTEMRIEMHIVLDAERKPQGDIANMLILAGQARRVDVPAGRPN
jgi:hypothetical protein